MRVESTYRFLLLLLQTEFVRCQSLCLTWDTIGNKVKITCRVPDFRKSVQLLDNNENVQVNCTLETSEYKCISSDKDNKITVDNELNEIILTVDKINLLHRNDVIWTCLWGKQMAKAVLSISRGIINATDVQLHGEAISSRQGRRIKLKCSSCRAPRGHNAEFLVNFRSEDSVTFSAATKTCTHYKGLCNKDDCSCVPSGNMFTWSFESEDFKNGLYISCLMNFIDNYYNSRFYKSTTIYFDGNDFVNNGTTTTIKKPPDEGRIGEEEDQIEHTDSTRGMLSTTKTTAIVNTRTDGEGLSFYSGLVIGLVPMSAVCVTCLTFGVCYYKRKIKRNQFVTHRKKNYTVHDKSNAESGFASEEGKHFIDETHCKEMKRHSDSIDETHSVDMKHQSDSIDETHFVDMKRQADTTDCDPVWQAQIPVISYGPVLAGAMSDKTTVLTKKRLSEYKDIFDIFIIGGAIMLIMGTYKDEYALLLLDTKCETQVSLQLHSSRQPLQMTEIDQLKTNKIALSYVDTHSVDIINVSTMEIVNKIDIPGKCRALSNYGHLICIIVNNKMTLIEQTGETFKSTTLPSNKIDKMCVHKEQLIYTSSDTLYSCDLDGMPIWEFKPNGIKQLYDLAVDGYGNSYVSGNSPYNVLVISASGKEEKTLLLKTTLVRLRFDRKTYNLLVFPAKNANIVDVYDIHVRPFK